MHALTRAAGGRCDLTVPEDSDATRDWVTEFEPALKLAFDEFMASAEWPDRERFRRKLIQRDLDHLSLDQLIQDMPRAPWESRQFPPDKIVLSLQVLQEMAEARPLLDVCVAMTRRAFAIYRSEDPGEPVRRRDDSVLRVRAGGAA